METASAIPGAPKEISLYAYRELLDREKRPAPALYLEGRWLRLGLGTHAGRRAADTSADLCRGHPGDQLFEFCCREHPDRSSGFRGARNGRLYPGRFLRNLWGSAEPTGGMEEWSPTGLSGGKASKTALRNEGTQICTPYGFGDLHSETVHCSLRTTPTAADLGETR